MQVTISARHGHLSSATQARITEKVEKLRRFNDRITSIAVTVNLEHEESPHVEVRVTAEHHEDFVATETSTGVSAALDRVIDKLENQLRKHKDKVTGRRTPGIKRLATDQESGAD